MTIRTQVLKLLKSHEAIVRQLQWYLFNLRVYMPIKRKFEAKYASRPTVINAKNHHGGFGFPTYPRICLFCNIMSNMILTWVFFKYLMPSLYNKIHRFTYSTLYGDWHAKKIVDSDHCFSFGRFVIHYEQSEELFGFFYAGCHLSWRVVQQIIERPFSLDVVEFLLQRREDISSFIKKLEAANGSIERRVRRQRRLSLPYKSDGTHLGLNYNHLTRHERLLCDIMCYEVTFVDILDEKHDDPNIFKRPARVMYKLRPNRTLEAHRRLVNLLAVSSLGVSVNFSMLVCLATAYIFCVVFLNQGKYYRDFINCDPDFTRLFEAGQIKHWSFPPLTGHRIFVFLGDCLENTVVWGESGLSGLFSLTFVGYINRDLLVYWDQLEEKIQKHCLQVVEMYELFGNMDHSTDTLLLRSFYEKTYDLQAQLRDFFHQIQRADLLVSDVITYALLIWLFGFGLISFKAAKLWSSTGNSDDIIIFFVISVVAFIGYSIVSFDILSLQRRCQRSYLAICSMMAHDQSRYKRHFIELNKFYTEKNRAHYTWFQQVPFSRANFFSVIVWSFTGFLVLDNVFNRH